MPARARAWLLGFSVFVFACRADGGAISDDESATASAATTGDASSGGSPTSGDDTPGDASSDASGSDGSGSDESGTTGGEPPACADPPTDPPCEALGEGRCFYIDPVDGDDGNDGTFASPWRTFVNVNSSIYYNAYPPAPQWVELGSGDVVYVRDGVIEQVFHPGDDSGPDGGGSFVLVLRQVDGSAQPITIKGYPGERPIIDPSEDALGISIAQSQGVAIEGIEVRGAWDRGIRIEGSEDVEVARVLVYDTDGVRADNTAGLEILASRNVQVRDSVFADNYDRAAAMEGTPTENGNNLVLFSNSGAISIRRCAFYQSGGASSHFSGFGVKYKHSSRDPEGTFELSDSYFEGNVVSFGNGTARSDVHHNVMVGSGYSSLDLGGPTHQWDQQLHHNTIIAPTPVYIDPTLAWVDHENGPWPDVSDNGIEANLIVDTSEMHHGEERTLLFDAYMSDEEHDALASGVTVGSNCYFREAGALSFGFAEATNYGLAGGAFDLEGWRDTYGFDVDSIEADPELDALRPAADGPCAEMGAFTDGHEPVVDFADPLACGDAASVRRWE